MTERTTRKSNKKKTTAKKKRTDRTKAAEKKHSLRIVFDGVIAVGPGHPDARDGSRDGPFFGVMARSTRRLSDRSERTTKRKAREGTKRSATTEEDLYIPMHVPTIFTLLTPTETSRPPDKVMQLSPWHPRWYMWHPVRERVEFRFDDNGEPGPLVYLHEPIPTLEHGGGLPDGSLSIHGIELVPDMRKIWHDRSVLLDGLLSADPNVNERVLAQVLVPFGMVAGAGVLEKGTPLDVVFDPPRDLDGQEELVPNAVVTVTASRVEIATYSLDSGRRLDSIELELTDDAEIWVSNGDPSDVEIDMNKLADEIARRVGGKGEVENKDQEAILQHFTTIFGLDGNDQAGLVAKILNFYHGGINIVNEGLVQDHPRAGNLDLDFELFYSLLKNEHLADDGIGLPVPKRPHDEDKFAGPNCLLCLSETNDRLYLKSNDR